MLKLKNKSIAYFFKINMPIFESILLILKP